MLNFLSQNDILSNPGAITVVVLVIIFGALAFLITGFLAYWQHNNDKWMPLKKKKNMKLLRAKLPQIFIGLSFFFLVLVIAFIQPLTS